MSFLSLMVMSASPCAWRDGEGDVDALDGADVAVVPVERDT
jgi:hypothetical protein